MTACLLLALCEMGCRYFFFCGVRKLECGRKSELGYRRQEGSAEMESLYKQNNS